MELIIFLVLGTFFLLKVVSKKGQDREHDKQLEANRTQREKRMNDWIRRVTDKRLEAELEEKIYTGLTGKEIQTAFENAAKGLPDSDINELRYDKTMVLRLLMAEHGKLRNEDASWGIHVYAYGPTEIRRLEDAEMKRRVVYHIQNKLIKHGIDEKITRKSTIKGGNATYMCDYIWEPMKWD